MSAFGLKCQRLQVGDVCISLKLREQKVESQLSPVPQKRNMYHHQMQQREMYYQQAKEQQMQHQQHQQQQLESLPQNLSRRASTNSASTTDASLAQMAKYSPAFYSLQMSLFAAASQGRLQASYVDFLNEDASHQQHDLNTSMNNNSSSDKLQPQSNLCSSSQDADDKSRKRRWSAPDIEEDQLLQQQQQMNQTNN